MEKSSKALIVLDVRTPEEYKEFHLDSSLNIDFLSSSFLDKISKLDKKEAYRLYCRSGNRSGKASTLMMDMGFADVKNLGTMEEASLLLSIPCVK